MKKKLLYGLCISYVFSVSAAFANQDITPLTMSKTPEGEFMTFHCEVNSTIGDCILDTGGNVTIIPDNSTNRKIKTISKNSIQDALGGKITVDEVKVDKMKVGGLLRENINAIRTNSYIGLKPFVAVVAADFFYESTTILDFSGYFYTDEQKMITGKTATKLASDFYFSLPLYQKNGHLILGMRYGGKTLKAVLDTGARVTHFSKRFIEENPELFTYYTTITSSGTALSSTAQSDKNVYFLKSDICFYDQCIKAGETAEALIGDLDMDHLEFDVVIGTNMYSKGSWLLDFVNNRYSVLLK